MYKWTEEDEQVWREDVLKRMDKIKKEIRYWDEDTYVEETERTISDMEEILGECEECEEASFVSEVENLMCEVKNKLEVVEGTDYKEAFIDYLIHQDR